VNGTAQAILGAGWKFPVRINGRGGFSLSRAEQDVAEAIWIVVSTARGERLMEPEFGCGIHDYVFASNDAPTRAAIAYEVQSALVRFEPRIDVLDVRAEEDPTRQNLLLVTIDYRIRANNAFHNVVYPFFLTEGEAGA
jgi:phage baseplate assembly protein W